MSHHLRYPTMYLLFLFLALGVFSTTRVLSQKGVDTYQIGDRKQIHVARKDTHAAAQKLVAEKRPRRERAIPEKTVLERKDISDLAKNYGLSQWIKVEPSAPFVSYWYDQKPSIGRLRREFVALGVILKAAKDEGLDPNEEKIYSVPPRYLTELLEKKAELQKTKVVEVPDLSNLSLAEARNELMEKDLNPDPRWQPAVGVEAGRVAPDSQNPSAKLKVMPGTSVRFTVSSREEQPLSPPQSTGSITVSVSQPKEGGKIICSQDINRIGRCEVNGGSSGVFGSNYGLLLWVRPVKPPAETDNWYLQRPRNGIPRLEKDGSWNGFARIGNSEYPPHEGDVLELAVSVADQETIMKLMNETGVVTRPEPVGIKVYTIQNVIVTLK